VAIRYSPNVGQLLFCDFKGTIRPEMDKKRPVVVLAKVAYNLCVIVPISTTDPYQPKPWHYYFHIPEPLPAPYDAEYAWAKCDMVSTVSYERLSLPFLGKNADGKRVYDIKSVSSEALEGIQRAVASVIFPSLLVDKP